MKINYGTIGILIGTIIVWYGILCWSFLYTVLSIIVFGALAGIVIKLMETRY